MAAITTAGNGNWSSVVPNTPWPLGTIPVEGDTVTINHTVTIDQDVTVGADTSTAAIAIGAAGVLQFDTTASRTLTLKGDLTIASGGQYLIGTAASPVPVANTITVKYNYSASMAHNKYGMKHTTWSSTSLVKMYGAARTRNVTLTSQALSGQAVINVSDATGWQAGDKVRIGGSTTTSEEKIILSIATLAVTLTTNLSNTHASGRPISNLTSNVILTSYNSSYNWFADMRIGTSGNHVLQDVELQYLNGSGTFPYFGYSSTSSTIAQIAIMQFTNSVVYRPLGLYGLCFFGRYSQGNSVTNSVFDGNAGTGAGLYFANSTNSNTVTNSNFYRLSYGIQSAYSAGGISNTVTGCKIYGSSTGAFGLLSGTNLSLSNNSYQGNISALHYADLSTDTIDISSSYGNDIVNTNDINFSAAAYTTALFDSCTFAGTNFITNSTYMFTGSKLSFGNCTIGGVAGEYRTYYAYGYLRKDTTNYRTASNSISINPTSTGATTYTFNVIGINAEPLAVVGYIRKNASYGASNPTVILTGLGVTTSTFTMADNTDWQLFTVSGTPTSSGLATVTVNTTYASGARVDIDDIIALTTTVNTGGFDYWYNGLPVSLMFSTGLGATDIWNVQTSQITTSGTFGDMMIKEDRNIKSILP